MKLLAAGALTFVIYLAINRFAPVSFLTSEFMTGGFKLGQHFVYWWWCALVVIFLLCHGALSSK